MEIQTPSPNESVSNSGGLSQPDQPGSANLAVPAKRSNRVVRILVGLALVLPAVAACIISLLIPSLQTIWLSLTKSDMLRTAEFIGIANYQQVLADPLFIKAASFTLYLIVERVLMVLVVPLLLALVLSEFSRAVRIVLRVVFSIPLALFAPVAAFLGWSVVFNTRGIFAGNTFLVNPTTAPWVLLLIDAVMTFGIACGVGLVVFRIALQGADTPKPRIGRMVKLLAVPWVLMVLGAIASGLQAFDPAYILTSGGPGNATMNLALYGYKQSYLFMRFGVGAVTSVLQLVVLFLMGILATVLLSASGVHIDLQPGGKSSGLFPSSPRAVAIILLVLVGGLSLIPVLLLLLPLGELGLTQDFKALSSLTSSFHPNPIPNTVFPVLISVLLIQFPLAYLAGLGIGGLRPLGKRSEWLLLLFAPWLFVTVEPVSTTFFQWLRFFKLNNTFWALISPLWLSVPMLFALVFFFKGRAVHWQAAIAQGKSASGSFFNQVFLPSLPFSALVVFIGLAVEAQQLLWPLIAVNTLNMMPYPTMMLEMTRQLTARTFSAQGTAVFMPWLVQSLIFFFLLVISQVLYVERLGIGPASDKEGSSS